MRRQSLIFWLSQIIDQAAYRGEVLLRDLAAAVAPLHFHGVGG
jgi:hypothetical protein